RLMAVLACACLNDVEMTRRNLFDLRTKPFCHQSSRMQLLALGYKYRRPFAKLCRYSSESSLCTTLGRACIDDLVDAVEQQRNKSRLGSAGKQIIANYIDAVMLNHLRSRHSTFTGWAAQICRSQLQKSPHPQIPRSRAPTVSISQLAGYLAFLASQCGHRQAR